DGTRMTLTEMMNADGRQSEDQSMLRASLRLPEALDSMPSYRVIGVMSGSSLDGLDLALCELELKRGHWSFDIEKAKTVKYSAAMQHRLKKVMSGSAFDLAELDAEIGAFIGKACLSFAKGVGRVDLIASHGHTIFHQPKKRITTQIGSGAAIAAISGITTMCDFRSTDVALGGQGAPLVPLGEKLLFPEHQAFLNIGGICNISLHGSERVIGYDVCIGNQALNFLANETGKSYDRDGRMASTGAVNGALLAKLNALPFHRQKPPRSLGREWFDANVLPLIANARIPLADRMRTVVEHIAEQVGVAAKELRAPLLVTGGGAHNSFLMDRLCAQLEFGLVIPSREVVDYKEALVFALLGVLRLRGEANALKSVTGAKKDSVGGAVYLAN
ncbi:MAG TPA: anhydro-N-acetylmuramic acid kinase, partial [Flavobacteriales bacterium]|nr:anhydro-N-acetylmuramic acid kinase [Flavobacteriales bacterium]